jgi:hypothetical protein
VVKSGELWVIREESWRFLREVLSIPDAATPVEAVRHYVLWFL